MSVPKCFMSSPGKPGGQVSGLRLHAIGVTRPRMGREWASFMVRRVWLDLKVIFMLGDGTWLDFVAGKTGFWDSHPMPVAEIMALEK